MSSHAASLARVRAQTAGAGRELFAGRRSCWWDCRRLCDAYIPFLAAGAACGGGEGAAYVQLACCALGALSTLAYLPFCEARRLERESFAISVAEGRFAATEDVYGWSCGGAPSATRTVAVDTAAIALVEIGCCCGGDVRVYLRDPATGGRRRNRCCGCECNAGPDHEFGYIEDNQGLARALREAAVTGASKAPPPMPMPMPMPMPVPVPVQVPGMGMGVAPPQQVLVGAGGYALPQQQVLAYSAYQVQPQPIYPAGFAAPPYQGGYPQQQPQGYPVQPMPMGYSQR